MRVQRLTAQLLSKVLCIAALASAALPAHAQTPTVDEVLKTYRDNRTKFSTLHVRLTHTREFTEAYHIEQRLRAEDLELFLGLVEKGGEFKVVGAGPIDVALALNSLRQDARQARREAEAPQKTQVERREFFQAGRSYQSRSWIRADDRTEPAKMPTAAISPASLLTDYRDYRIFSWTDKQAPPGRIWQGGHRLESTACQLSESEIESWPNNPYAPFLGSGDQDDIRFPCESFFQGSAENYRVVGTEEVENRTCVVVEFTVVRRGQQQLSRATLDMSRGALPLRIQRWSAWPGATFESVRNWPHFHLTTTKEIIEVDPGCWYPSSVDEEESRAEPKADHAIQRLAWFIPAANRLLRLPATFTRTQWHCDLVERSFPHGDDFFVLKFPPDLSVFDIDAAARREQERKPLVTAGQPAPPLTVARWISGENLSLDQLRGRVIVLTFGTLKSHADYDGLLRLLHDKYAERPVDFITVYLPEGNSEQQIAEVTKLVQEQKWSQPVAIDAGTDRQSSRTFLDYGLETTAIVVIGPDGIVLQNDQEFPEEIEQDEAAAEAWFKNWIVSAGETWPIPDDMPIEEQKKLSDRVNLFHKSKAIDEGLKKIEGVTPAAGTR